MADRGKNDTPELIKLYRKGNWEKTHVWLESCGNWDEVETAKTKKAQGKKKYTQVLDCGKMYKYVSIYVYVHTQ